LDKSKSVLAIGLSISAVAVVLSVSLSPSLVVSQRAYAQQDHRDCNPDGHFSCDLWFKGYDDYYNNGVYDAQRGNSKYLNAPEGFLSSFNDETQGGYWGYVDGWNDAGGN
jgi:hypothetical protein